MRPAAHLPFFASSKKGRPKKDDPTVRVPSLRYGQPAMLVRGACRRTHCALTRYAQTTAASQFTKAGVLRRQPAPRPALLGTARREGGTVRAIAALGLVRGASSAGPSAAMARVGLFTPLWLRLGRGAFGVSVGVAAPTHRCLTCRGCLNGAPQARSEFCGTPRKRPDPGLPRSSSVGVADLGACSLPPFLHEQERRSPAGARPGQQTSRRRATHAIPASPRGQN